MELTSVSENSNKMLSCILSPQSSTKAPCERSPESSCESPEFNTGCITPNTNSSGRENRRGRPRSETLPSLIYEGVTSPSSIKCRFCNRTFPREKSLQAHLRTHTGERPYTCDYPGCTRAFTQSGQLKTHQRLHTGERPFVCAAANCNMRFTHANRHCPDHPYEQLKRCDDFVIHTIPEQNYDVIKWMEKYRMEREDRTPTRKTPKRTKLNDYTDGNNENAGQPVTPNNPYKSRKGLMIELDMNAGFDSSPLTAKNFKPNPKVIKFNDVPPPQDENCDDFEVPKYSAFNHKKKWLREAWQDELAKPLDPPTFQQTKTLHPQQTQPLNPNQTRPTVLMVVSKDKTIPLTEIKSLSNINSSFISSTMNSSSISSPELSPQSPYMQDNRKWLGALALMEMSKDDSVIKNKMHDSNYEYNSPPNPPSYTQL